MHKYDLIVVGGGASGLMAAGVAAARGKRVLLLEKNDTLGKKLAITGGSRCNITNNTPDINTFLEKFPEGKKYLYSAFSRFSVTDTIHFFEETLKLPLTTQAGARMFPRSEKATDVRDALVDYARVHGVTIMTNTSVTEIHTVDELISHISTSGRDYHASSYIIATGGLAAPHTGSTGDGFRWLADCGHKVHKPNPNIVPLITDNTWLKRCSGTTLSDIRITFMGKEKKIKKDGNILLTHFGLSGPLILNTSKEVSTLLKDGPVHTMIDLFPSLNEKELDQKLVSLLSKNPRKKINNLLPLMIPRSFARELSELDGFPNTEIIATELSREDRKIIVSTLKKITLNVTDIQGFDKAVIADGGLDPSEIDWTTMCSRHYKNLYCTGDMISINRPSGGYSLQLAWTTAWIAAQNY